MYATDLSLRTIKCCYVVFGVTLRLLVINISSSSPAINKLRRLLPAISVTSCSLRWSQILVGKHDFCLLHLYSTPPLGGFPSEYCHDVWYGKTRMAWLPAGEKKSEDTVTVFDRKVTSDTAWRYRRRLCIASRWRKKRKNSRVNGVRNFANMGSMREETPKRSG